LAIFAELSDGGALDPARGRRVARLAEEDLEATEALDLRKQVIHGDAHLENVLMDSDGPLWNDWEDAFVGVVEWDLACLVATARVTGAGRARTELALRGYGIDRLHGAVDVFVRLRAFQVATWLLAMAAGQGSLAEQAEPWLDYVEHRPNRPLRVPPRLWRRIRDVLRS